LRFPEVGAGPPIGPQGQTNLNVQVFGQKSAQGLFPGLLRLAQQEFIQHVLERELGKIEEGESDEEIVKKLQGLGYID
jgi:hypothetical protein